MCYKESYLPTVYFNTPCFFDLLIKCYFLNPRQKNGRRNHKIFTYVDNDDYANTEEVLNIHFIIVLQ